MSISQKTEAAEKYWEYSKEIQFLNLNILAKLKEHRRFFNANPTNWRSVGDLAKIINKLTEIKNFLK